jgi:uncharacterized protein YjbI with pentapeptide repeats
MEILEYLQAEDVEGFNANRSQRTAPNLFAADLAGKTLTSVDLEGANVEKADLSDSDLTEANLMHARFTGIDGTNLKLTGAVALKIRLMDAWLENADLSAADMTKANLSEAYLRGSTATKTRMSGARLKDADCKNVKWADVELPEANFTRADFSNADLSRATLTDAVGTGALLDGARLDGAQGSGVKLPGASLKNVSMASARLAGANFQEADLTGAKLMGADLSGANLSGATLIGADLSGALLANASFRGADLTRANMSDCDLTGVDPHEAGLSAGQIASLGTYGAGLAAVSPTIVRRPKAAINGKAALVLWVNGDDEDEDEDEPLSMRWAMLKGGKPGKGGVLSLDASAVLSHHVVPVGKGFELVILLKHPEGVQAVRYVITIRGKVESMTRSFLGYSPMVVPIVHGGDRLSMFGLARRGPTVAAHRVGEEGLGVAWSRTIPTAQGFLGRHHPVLACKGAVVMPLLDRMPGKPLSTPEEFPGRVAAAVPLEDVLMLVWVSASKTKDGCGIWSAQLFRRGTPEVDRVSETATVTTLDATRYGDDAWACWLEATNILERKIMLTRIGGKPQEVKVSVDAHDLQFAVGGTAPHLIVTTLDDGVMIVDRKGKPLGEIDTGFTVV